MAFGARIQGSMPGGLPFAEFFGSAYGGLGGWSSQGPLFGGFGPVASSRTFSRYIPTEGWDPVAKAVIAGVLSSVGYGDFEQGVFDTPIPGVPPILPPTVVVGPKQVPTAPPGQVSVPTSTEAQVAIDWGGLIGDLGSQYIASAYAPQQSFVPFVSTGMGAPAAPSANVGGPDGITWGNGGSGSVASSNELCGSGPCGSPRYLTYDCRTGTFSKKRRRRRGRLLTASDQHDLGVIVAMFGKGAAGQIALAAAVKR